MNSTCLTSQVDSGKQEPGGKEVVSEWDWEKQEINVEFKYMHSKHETFWKKTHKLILYFFYGYLGKGVK